MFVTNTFRKQEKTEMITIWMEDADESKARNVASHFASQNLPVQVRNGGDPFVLAILGVESDYLNLAEIEKMPGVLSCKRDSELFDKQRHHFREAYLVFSWGH